MPWKIYECCDSNSCSCGQFDREGYDGMFKPSKFKNEIHVEKSAWQDVLDALGLELKDGKTIDDIESINKKDGIVYSDAT